MKTETKTPKPEPDGKATDYNTYIKMLFAIRAINVIVKAVRERNPILDEYTSAGLENIEAWAEYGLLLQMEDSPSVGIGVMPMANQAGLESLASR